MLIEVAETHPAAVGKKVATVVAAGGTRLECWPEMLGTFQVGRRYEVEIAERVYNGRTFQKITKATPYGNGDGAITAAAAARTSTPNGYASGNSDYSSERMFVCTILSSYIRSGRCANPSELTQTINALRDVWRRTFGVDAE